MASVASRKRTAFDYLNVTALLLFTFLCIYPLYFILINSFSTSIAVAKGVYFWPMDFNTRAYESIFKIRGLATSAFVSVSRTVVGAGLTVLCCSFCAYIVTHRDLPVRKLFYRFFIITMYVNAGFIPYYLTVTNLGLKNSFLVYVLPGALSGYYIVLIKTYIESLPISLTESAEMDGAGILRVYAAIVMPLSMPILACIVVFAAVGQWNTWSDNLFFITSRAKSLNCLQYLLYLQLQQNMAEAAKTSASAAASIKVTPTTARMAMTFITMLPILCVYPFMQRYFIKGIMLGAIKG